MGFFEQYKDDIMAFFKAFYELVVTIFGKLTVGLEYQYTAAQYGDTINNKGLATENLRWVANKRIQSIVRFNY